MDSPNSTTATATPSTASTTTALVLSDYSPVQESPFLKYVNNLSPIESVKVARGTQQFAVLSSPCPIFTTPRALPECRATFLQRSQLCQTPGAEMLENDGGGSKKLVVHSNNLEESVAYHSRLITDAQKEDDAKNSARDQPGSSSGCVDEYLNDPVDGDSANSVNLVNSKVKQSEEFSQGHSAVEIKLGQPEEEKHCSKQPFGGRQNFESEVDHAPEKKQLDSLGTHIIDANEDYGDNMAASAHGAIQSILQRDPEASQLQRGLSRRCLQFAESRQKTTLNSIHSKDLANNVNGTGLPSAIERENLDSSHVDLASYSGKQMIVNVPEPATSTFHPRFIGKAPMVVSKPSGIGLHLNSIVNTMPMGHAMASIKLTPTMSSHHDAGETMLQSQDSLSADAAISDSFFNEKYLNALLPVERHASPLNKRNLNSEPANNFEEFSQLSPAKKKRKKSSTDGDGCKRCNCKKTKCLKLYCDCFAAGNYCAEPCSCQGCFNRPEYEDTVLETRQQIESRNPLAFAPKIVQNVTDFAAASREDGSRSIPSLSRHKRGCNCKKSMCLKKYCECCQANVGCSSECRCEGCKNVYGRKGEYRMAEANRVGEERFEGRVNDKLAIMATNKDLLNAELYDVHDITPSTPSFQHSDHGKGVLKSQLSSSRYVQSPESDFSTLPSYGKSKRSPRNSHSNDMIPERSKEIVDIDSSGQGMDCNISEMIGQFSPKCTSLTDVYDLSPLRSSGTVAASVSSKTREWTSGSRFQLCSRSGPFSSGRSLRWRSSPITPMTRLGETKNPGHDSDSGLYRILEDDTPEILKEASTPSASVKASSPNKKRVSPPHNHFHDFRSSSSGGLKSGRKFILKSVPSLPPLTPCINSKGTTEEKHEQ